MATRKTRKFAEGGMSDEDVASFAGTSDNDSNAGMMEKEPAENFTPTPKKQTFKEAFAAARGAGDKTFEFGGKKYTTELAKPKAAAKAAPKAEFKSLAPADKGETRKALPLKSTKSETGNKFMGATGLKKGGSVKGWGQARGARKAKMY